jgi:hypothetical protein
MNFLGYKITKEEPKTASKFYSLEPPRIELPEIKEDKNREWVLYGKKNLYPRELLKLTETSALHSAIVSSKATMMAGKSILINDMPQQDYYKTVGINDAARLKAQLRQFENIRHKLAVDYQHFGAYAYEMIFSMDFTRIIKVNHVNVSDIRSGKYEDGVIKNYWWSRDWADEKKYPPQKIAAYDPTNKTDYRQLVYRCAYSPDQEYYGKPTYQSALCWIKLDSEIGLFHLSNVENGMFPGLHFKFYKKPQNKEEEQTIMRQLDQHFKGPWKANKKFVSFSDGKDLALDISPITQPDLDKQFIQIGETVVQQIISAHKVTSPMLLGIATPGKLGYSNELENAQKIFESQVIAPQRNMEEMDFQEILEYNGFSETITLEPFNPLLGDAKIDTTNKTLAALNTLSPLVANKVLESLSQTEIRKLIDLGPSTEPPQQTIIV